MSVDSLPQELVDLIFALLCDDRRALAALSLALAITHLTLRGILKVPYAWLKTFPALEELFLEGVTFVKESNQTTVADTMSSQHPQVEVGQRLPRIKRLKLGLSNRSWVPASFLGYIGHSSSIPLDDLQELSLSETLSPGPVVFNSLGFLVFIASPAEVLLDRMFPNLTRLEVDIHRSRPDLEVSNSPDWINFSHLSNLEHIQINIEIPPEDEVRAARHVEWLGDRLQPGLVSCPKLRTLTLRFSVLQGRKNAVSEVSGELPPGLATHLEKFFLGFRAAEVVELSLCVPKSAANQERLDEFKSIFSRLEDMGPASFRLSITILKDSPVCMFPADHDDFWD
ncbi:hypothetical protein FA15DRAFT_714151 [Coprinopsis marcescibilis]|uniref:F-box domain-containing protein n=1 Tax=Coprinopsis marcescibilis TaxID=230819 RepID=A0A5C3L751_COPMA|nr:hypothetical protein FA15DRAFT_714151 [Coprinopsis marcescibilis]